MSERLAALIAEWTPVAGHRPWPRYEINDAAWVTIAQELGKGGGDLLGLWGDAGAVHMGVLDEGEGEIAVVTIACPDGRFPSVGAAHPPAIRPERAMRDLWGLEPIGTPDPRPWLDLGFWSVQHPLGARGDRAGDRHRRRQHRARRVDMQFGQPHRVEAVALGGVHLVEGLGKRVRLTAAGHHRKLVKHPEFHRASFVLRIAAARALYFFTALYG